MAKHSLLVQHFFKMALRERILFFHLLLLIGSLLLAYFLAQTAPIDRTQISLVLMGEASRILCFLMSTTLISSYFSKIKNTSEYDFLLTNTPSLSSISVQLFLCGTLIYTSLMGISILVHFLLMPQAMTGLTILTYAMGVFLEGGFFILAALFFLQRISSTKAIATVIFLYTLARLKSSIVLTFLGLFPEASGTATSTLKFFFFFVPDLAQAPPFIGAPFSLNTLLIDNTSTSLLLMVLIVFQNRSQNRRPRPCA